MWIDLRSQWEQTPVASNSIAGVLSAVLLAGTADISFPDINASLDAALTQGSGAITMADLVGPVDGAQGLATAAGSSADLAGAISAILLQGDGALAVADIAGTLDAARLIGDGAVFSADVIGLIDAFNIANLTTTTDFTWADINGALSAVSVQGDGSINFSDLFGVLSASRLQADGALLSASVHGIVDAIQLNSLVQIEGSVADVTISIDGVLLEAGVSTSVTLGPMGPMSASIGFVEPRRKKKRYPEPTPEVIEAPVVVAPKESFVLADVVAPETIRQLTELKTALKATQETVKKAQASDDESIAIILLGLL